MATYNDDHLILATNENTDRELVEHKSTKLEEAEKQDFVKATKLLTDAQGRVLDNAEFEEANSSIDALKDEIDKMLEYMNDQGDIYDKKGRPFALSTNVSQEGQRGATPRMDAYLKQAEAFENSQDHPELVTSINALTDTVGKMLEYMKEGDTDIVVYDQKQGSSKTSHGCQPSASSKGDDVKNISSFATPRMDLFLEQAEAFDTNPEQPELVTSVMDHKKVEASDTNPLGNVSPSLIQNLEDAIEALGNITSLMSQSRK